MAHSMDHSPGIPQRKGSGDKNSVTSSEREKDYLQLAAMFRRQRAPQPQDEDLEAMSDALQGGRFDHFLAAVLDARFPGRRDLDPYSGAPTAEPPTLGDFFRNLGIRFEGLRASKRGKTLDLESEARSPDRAGDPGAWEFSGERCRSAFFERDFEACLRSILSIRYRQRSSTRKFQVPQLLPDSASDIIAKSTLRDYFQALHIALSHSVADSEHDSDDAGGEDKKEEEQYFGDSMDESGSYDNANKIEPGYQGDSMNCSKGEEESADGKAREIPDLEQFCVRLFRFHEIQGDELARHLRRPTFGSIPFDVIQYQANSPPTQSPVPLPDRE